MKERLLTYSERYKLWFANNYETGMEYNEDIVPDFDDDYYKPTPTKLTTITYKNEKTKIMNNETTIKLQQELIDLYETQITDLTMMSKIELGDDVIEEIKRLKGLLN